MEKVTKKKATKKKSKKKSESHTVTEVESGQVELQSGPTEEQKKAMQQELQRQFNKVKKTLKVRSKSELVAMIWEQGMEFKQLQAIAQELYEENKQLKQEKGQDEEIK